MLKGERDMFDNEMHVSFLGVSQNESFARMVAAAFASQLNPTIEELTDIRTAVSEAVTNAIIHGYSGMRGMVGMDCAIEGRNFTVTIRDEGRGIPNVPLAMQPFYTSVPNLERSGMGFAVAAMRGSENNDPYRIDAETGEIEAESNNAGGILGGISTGAPVMWRMAVKPTPSIGREQQTVDMDAMENAELSVHGRHDPCIVPRAVPVAEAAAALAIWDALLEDAAQL